MAEHEEDDYSGLARYEFVRPAMQTQDEYLSWNFDKARCAQTGKLVAMKRHNCDADYEGLPREALREIDVLRKLASHEHIVELLDVFCETNHVWLVFELLDMDLRQFILRRGRVLEQKAIQAFACQLLRGMAHCHGRGVLHRQLEPCHLLIDARLRLKVAGFGLARLFSLPHPNYTRKVVTLWYRPPEILLGSPFYSTPVDLWSCGCVLAEMASGWPLFSGDSEIGTIFKIFQKLGTPSAEEWPDFTVLPDYNAAFPKWRHSGWESIRNIKAQVGPAGISLLEKLLAYDPKQRIMACSATEHPYFADVEVPPELFED